MPKTHLLVIRFSPRKAILEFVQSSAQLVQVSGDFSSPFQLVSQDRRQERQGCFQFVLRLASTGKGGFDFLQSAAGACVGRETVLLPGDHRPPDRIERALNLCRRQPIPLDLRPALAPGEIARKRRECFLRRPRSPFASQPTCQASGRRLRCRWRSYTPRGAGSPVGSGRGEKRG